MDSEHKQRLVRQYVERQQAYVPMYTTGHLLSEHPGTPATPLRSDQFGFDTPVLRPRVPVNKTAQPKLAQKAEQSKSRTHGTDSGLPSSQVPPPAPVEAPSEPKHRKKASTPVDTDDEHEARLADRRERKRKKRAIVNPLQKHDEDAAAPRKGRKSGKKPAALALLYGFSATNVTKDRLTLKPAPSLGVFGKGKASAKKKVTATKKSSSKNEIFSEFAFLNKPNERAADHSKVDNGSNDSSISDDGKPQATHTKNRTKQERGKCNASTALQAPPAPARTTAESEVWDIELQSKLPSSACDISSEREANDSAPVVLDVRGVEWSTSLNVAVEHEARCNKARTRSLSLTRSSPLDRSDHLGIPQTGDEAPSIHPSHSASQVGRRATDIRSSELRQVTSKYFAVPEPVAIQRFATESQHVSRSNDSLDVLHSRTPDQGMQDTAIHVQTVPRVASPTSSNSLNISGAQPMIGSSMRYDVAPFEFPSDSSYDDCCARTDGALEPLGDYRYFRSSIMEMQGSRSTGTRLYPHGYFESSVVEPQGAAYQYPQQGSRYDLYGRWCASSGDDDATQGSEGYDLLTPEHEDYLGEPTAAAEYDPGEEQLCRPCFCMDETREDYMYEDEGLGVGAPEFLEGRALLLGVPEWPPRGAESSGLAQAEMDVARRLRGHWRPLRL